jgi:hypothetical protein
MSDHFNHRHDGSARQSFILGMELAMRIARNHSTGKELSDPVEQKLQTSHRHHSDRSGRNRLRPDAFA